MSSSDRLLPHIQGIDADEAGPDPSEVSRRYGIPLKDVVMLGRNENPYGPSPRALEAMKGAGLHRYPDRGQLLEALSHYTGHPAEGIILGAGLDEIILNLPRLFLGAGDRALIPVPTYTLYALSVRLCGAQPVLSPRLEGSSLDALVPEGVKMTFLCTPNNPTGGVISEEEARAIAEGAEGIVFIDEAYAEFASSDLLGIVREHENVVVGRTLSKAFGLAGARVGYALAPEWLAEVYRRIGPLFGISSPSIAAATAALGDLEHMRNSVRRIASERERMARALGARPSQANFLCLRTGERSCAVHERLMRRGIVVRDCSGFPGAGEHMLRVTVGTPEENDAFLDAYSEVMRGFRMLQKPDQ